MFFLKLLTNKDVIHINFHSPQALPTLHLLLADIVGTSDPRQEWQTQHLSCSVLQAAWQCQGSADHSKSPFWAECVPQRSWHSLFYEWQLICTVQVVQRAPKVVTVCRGPGEGMGLGCFPEKSCLTLPAATGHLWEEWRGSVLSISDFT